jgi:hypothetical protein
VLAGPAWTSTAPLIGARTLCRDAEANDIDAAGWLIKNEAFK